MGLAQYECLGEGMRCWQGINEGWALPQRQGCLKKARRLLKMVWVKVAEDQGVLFLSMLLFGERVSVLLSTVDACACGCGWLYNALAPDTSARHTRLLY